MQGKYLEWNTFSTVAICGKSGSGKTSTVRFIIAQMLLNGVHTIVCDPHGNAGNDSLKMSIEPIEQFLALPVAVDLEDRIKAFRYVHKILRARIAGTDTSKQRICIILDEATYHFLECSKEQAIEFTRFLHDLTNEGRKKDICVFLLGQNFKADFVGSRSIRSSITHVIFHRTSEDETKLFVPSMPAKEKRTIAQLPTGHIFVYPFLYRLRVPYITHDDMIDFARSFKRASSVQDTVQAKVQDYNAERANVQEGADHTEKPINETLARSIKAIIKSYLEGKSKEQTIFDVLQIRKSGSSKRWKIADRFYTNVIKRYDEQNTK